MTGAATETAIQAKATVLMRVRSSRASLRKPMQTLSHSDAGRFPADMRFPLGCQLMCETRQWVAGRGMLGRRMIAEPFS